MRCFRLALLTASLIGWGSACGAPELDPASGLIKDEGWELVRSNCVACHSLRLVTGQRADRQTWLDIIRWMQATQNLWQFDAQTEDKLLSYLAKNYPPQAGRRRASIPPDLMPPR